HCPTSPPATLTKAPLPLPETCQRPRWGTGLRLVPDLEVYRKNEEVMLSCPQGLQPSYTHVRCAGGTGASDRAGSLSRNMWQGRNSIGAWNPIVGTVQCLVPQKPEQLQLDARTGMITWKALPPCLGEIIEYQLNITVRPLQNGSFLQIERLRLSSQTTEYLLPAYGTSTRYAVAMRGLTAVGPGAASLLEFHTNSSETPGPSEGCSRLDISPSQGTAVLPLHPISQPPEAVRLIPFPISILIPIPISILVLITILNPFSIPSPHPHSHPHP
ncbi:hypothetical protein ASZ78_012306, partial [Callipepla squamata]